MAARKTAGGRNTEKFRDIRPDAEGNYIYTGEILRITGDAKKQRVQLAAILLSAAAAVIASGCIDAAGAGDAFYVIVPYIGEVSALFMLTWDTVRIISGGKGIRRYVYDSVSGRIPGACRILMVFALAGAVMSVIYLVKNGAGESPVRSIAYPVLKLAGAGAAEAYMRMYSRIRWESTS